MILADGDCVHLDSVDVLPHQEHEQEHRRLLVVPPMRREQRSSHRFVSEKQATDVPSILRRPYYRVRVPFPSMSRSNDEPQTLALAVSPIITAFICFVRLIAHSDEVQHRFHSAATFLSKKKEKTKDEAEARPCSKQASGMIVMITGNAT